MQVDQRDGIAPVLATTAVPGRIVNRHRRRIGTHRDVCDTRGAALDMLAGLGVTATFTADMDGAGCTMPAFCTTTGYNPGVPRLSRRDRHRKLAAARNDARVTPTEASVE